MRFTPQAVLFDLDGTLVDSALDLVGALNKMRVARGLTPLQLEPLRAYASAGVKGLLKQGLNIAPEEVDFDSAKDEFLNLYEAGVADQTVFFEGVEALLTELESRGMPWGIITNKATRFTLPLLKALGLSERASIIVCGDTTPYAKPHPAPMQEACRQLKIDPTQAIYIGDDRRDAQAAQAVNMPCVVAAYGYLGDTPDYSSWGAQAFIHHPLELLALL